MDIRVCTPSSTACTLTPMSDAFRSLSKRWLNELLTHFHFSSPIYHALQTTSFSATQETDNRDST